MYAEQIANLLFYWILFQREIISQYEIRVSKMTNLTINTICILSQQKVFQWQQSIAWQNRDYFAIY